MRRRALLRVSELRVLMNVVAPSCDLVGDRRCSTVDFGRKRWVGDDDLLSRRAVPGERQKRRKDNREAPAAAPEPIAVEHD